MEAYNQKFLKEMIKMMEKKFSDSEIKIDQKFKEHKKAMKKEFEVLLENKLKLKEKNLSVAPSSSSLNIPILTNTSKYTTKS